MGKTGTCRRFIYASIVVALAVSAILAILAAINFQPSCTETGIIPVGELRVNGTTPVWGLIGDVGSFKSPDGHIHLLIAGYSDGVMVVNVTNPSAPVQTGSSIPYGSLGELWRIDTEVFESPDGRTYALLTGKGAMILDVTDPQNPALINNTLNDPGVLDDAFDATLFEPPDGRTYAWVKGATHGVKIFDVTDPHHPALIVDRDGDIFGHDIGAIFEPPDGRTYAMSSNSFLGLYIEDITDPHNPVPVAVMRYAGDSVGPYQRTAAAFPELPVIFIPDEHAAGLYHAENIATFEPPDGRTYAMIANSGITSHSETYTRIIPTGILFMDVTDPHAPVPTYDIRNGDDGFDIGSHIRYITIFEAPDGHTYAAIAGGMGVLIMNITDPHAPVPISEIQDGENGFHAAGAVSGMTVFEPSDGIIHLAAVSSEGVQIADVTDPHQPVPVSTVWDDQRGIFALGRAYYHTVFEPGDGHTYALGTGNDGVHFVDVTVPHAPIPVGSIWDGRNGFDTLERAGQTALLESADGRSYILVGSSEGVQIADVTDPHNPRPAGSLRDGLESVWITGIAILEPADDRAYALIADHGVGIHIVDVTDPSTPVPVGGMLAGDNFDILGGVHGVAVYGQQSDGHHYALVASDFGMHTVDVANPLDPVLAGVVQGSVGNRTSTEFYHPFPLESPDGRTYALTGSGSGIRILDITDPYDPVSAGSMPVGDDIFVLHFGTPITATLSYDDHTYALTGSGSGIRILDITDPYNPLLLNSTLAGEADFSLDENSWYGITFPKYLTLFEADDGRTYALAGSDSGMRILDVTKPYIPVSVGRADDASNACQ